MSEKGSLLESAGTPFPSSQLQTLLHQACPAPTPKGDHSQQQRLPQREEEVTTRVVGELQEKQETASAPWEGLGLSGRTQLTHRKTLVSQTTNFISQAWHRGVLHGNPKNK